VFLLAGCAQSSASPPDLASALLVPEALAQPSRGEVSVVGYLLEDAAGVRLVDGLVFGREGPRAPSDPAEQLWLGEGPVASAGLNAAGAVRYGLALVGGRIEGPGAYGPGGRHRFRLQAPAVRVQVPQEASLETLLKRSSDYTGKPVRVTGSLLARPGAALLLERLGPGGAPAPGARQVKLAGPLREALLPESLSRSPSGDVRFGVVQVEGVWRNDALTPLAILPVTQ
jgi:hypothetical protein